MDNCVIWHFDLFVQHGQPYGSAFESTKSSVLASDGYQEAGHTLSWHFGDSHPVTESQTSLMMEGKPVKPPCRYNSWLMRSLPAFTLRRRYLLSVKLKDGVSLKLHLTSIMFLMMLVRWSFYRATTHILKTSAALRCLRQTTPMTLSTGSCLKGQRQRSAKVTIHFEGSRNTARHQATDQHPVRKCPFCSCIYMRLFHEKFQRGDPAKRLHLVIQAKLCHLLLVE